MTKSFWVEIASTEKKREVLPTKTYLGICYSIIDLWTHDENFQWTINSLRKIKITWELPKEKRVFKKDEEEKPMVLSKDYTLSFGEKANLKKMFDSRGVKIEKNFEFSTLLGKPALLSVGLTEAKNGNQYNNINGVSDILEGMKVPKQVNENVLFNCYDFDMDEWNKVNEWTQKIIKKSDERSNIYDKFFNDEAPKAKSDDDLPF